ncbi:WGxxGxxG family protein [Egbenema bharatensis]|uniref:WGxxGxxG family protein n=1 Tax=Egbenema bharatensis TaxID=3463334 RepID=UPI003A8597F7
MNSSKLIKFASIGFLSLGLTVLPFSAPVSAQETAEDNNPIAALNDTDFDWGLLGLLGLLGLFGLAGRGQSKQVDSPPLYRDPNVNPNATPSPTDYRKP